MKRMLIITATAAGAVCAAAVPAFAGLAGNPSFSHRVPVQVPSQARVVQFDDHGGVVGEHPAGTDDGPSSVPSSTKSPEPGDDNGGVLDQSGEDNGGASASTEPGDDNSPSSEPGDDNSSTEPGDDNGTDANSPSTEPTDDHGAAGGGTTAPDDNSTHGGGTDGSGGHGGSDG